MTGVTDIYAMLIIGTASEGRKQLTTRLHCHVSKSAAEHVISVEDLQRLMQLSWVRRLGVPGVWSSFLGALKVND